MAGPRAMAWGFADCTGMKIGKPEGKPWIARWKNPYGSPNWFTS